MFPCLAMIGFIMKIKLRKIQVQERDLTEPSKILSDAHVKKHGAD